MENSPYSSVVHKNKSYFEALYNVNDTQTKGSKHDVDKNTGRKSKFLKNV